MTIYFFLLQIDVTIGNISLVDQFEWDVNCQKNDPELFAEILTAELGLGGEFRYFINFFFFFFAYDLIYMYIINVKTFKTPELQ